MTKLNYQYIETSSYNLSPAIDAQANALLGSSSYGKTLTSSTWYNNVSDIELLARIIYAENTTNKPDQTGVAWVIINRKNYATFPDTYRDVVLHYDESYGGYQFQSVTSSNAKKGHTKPSSNASTIEKLDYEGWKHATWLACAMMATSSESDYMYLFGKPLGIDKQLFLFRSMNVTFGTRDGYITVNGDRSKNVAYAGLGEVSSAADAQLKRDEMRNIFYSYYNN